MKKEKEVIEKELESYVEKVVKFANGVAWMGSERMENLELASIAAECRMLKELKIWKLFQEKIRFNAVENMMTADTLEKMQDAKRILRVLNDMVILVENFIEQEKLLPRTNPKPPVSNPRQ